MQESFETFGDYILLEKLAMGGMAEVYLAKKIAASGVQKFVAIKRILEQFSNSTDFIKMFKDEANTSINLAHSNVVSIYDFGIEKSQFYIVMEFVEGKNLRQILNKIGAQGKRFDRPQVTQIIKEAAAGLDHAHRCLDPATGKSLNIIHRDISPQNIMLDFEGNTKIVDFGISKTEKQIDATQAGTLKGKFGYMSPEQVNGETLDPRTDIFALGIVLWELLANKRLFAAKNEVQILRKISECNIPDLSQFTTDVPPELQRIIDKCLHKNREQRYQTAHELNRDLQSFQNRFTPDFSPYDLSLFLRESFSTELDEMRLKLMKYSQAEAIDSDADKTILTMSDNNLRPEAESLDHINFDKVRAKRKDSFYVPIAPNPNTGLPQIQTTTKGKNLLQRKSAQAQLSSEQKPQQSSQQAKPPTTITGENSQKADTYSTVQENTVTRSYSIKKKKSPMVIACCCLTFAVVTFIYLKSPSSLTAACQKVGQHNICNALFSQTKNQVIIKTQPSQSKIYINGKNIGLSPTPIKYGEFPLTLKIVKAGYRSIEKDINKVPEQTELTYRLQPIPVGYLIVKALGVQIFVNGEEVKNGEKVAVEASKETLVKTFNPFNKKEQQQIYRLKPGEVKKVLISM